MSGRVMHSEARMVKVYRRGIDRSNAASIRCKLRLLAVEVDRTLEPPWRGFATTKDGAVNAQRLAQRAGQLDHAAIPQGQAMGADEAQAAVVHVARVEQPWRRRGGVAEQAQ